MLSHLHILNYAIIDEIKIDFPRGLNVITGETGAGKSILMGALSLILGDRADTSVLMDREKKCFIEGSFQVEHKPEVREFLRTNDLDQDSDLVIRREITANGKSRAFVNDTPVNLDQLRHLSSLLVDLHRQFDTLELSESVFQREVIDALAAHRDVLNKYALTYNALILAQRDLDTLRNQKIAFTREYDYNKFLHDELEEAGLGEQEIENAEAELEMLNHAEGIKAALAKLQGILTEDEKPVVNQLKTSVNQLQSFTSLHPALPSILQRLQSSQIELQDIAGEISHIDDSIQYDLGKIEMLNEKISTGYRLYKKHNVHSTGELLMLKNSLSSKLQAVHDMDDSIRAQELKVSELNLLATQQAAAISKTRIAQLKPFEKKVNHLLAQVGMPNAKLMVSLEHAPLSESGADQIAFLFDANKSNRFEPLRKVASGGELSRLMLCIKSLIAESVDLPTLIFDEIDTGISGEAARQVGIILKELARQRQVLCITHQPQIAGKAEAHHFVYKEIRGDKVKTNIRQLSQDERITTIARMLSGEKPTAAALENAREMVMN